MSHFKRSRPLFSARLLSTLLAALFSFPPVSSAEAIAVPLAQEQDGGGAGRACIYIWNGSAQYRVIKGDEVCAAEITVERETLSTDGNI